MLQLPKFISFIILLCCSMLDASPPVGFFSVGNATYLDEGFQSGSNETTRHMVVHYPSNGTSTDRFPLIVYAHGASAGGLIMAGYNVHFSSLASYGFVIIAPDSCMLGCAGGPLHGGWKTFRFEQIRALEFAKAQTSTTWGKIIDWSHGVAIAGHSMGGTSLVLNSAKDVATTYDIKATAVQHGFAIGTDYTEISVPTMVFTGTNDSIVFPAITKQIYTGDPTIPKAYRNQEGVGHLEMMIPNPNPYIAFHTAAWFKVHLLQDKDVFYKAVYGSGPDSFCNNTVMKECEVKK